MGCKLRVCEKDRNKDTYKQINAQSKKQTGKRNLVELHNAEWMRECVSASNKITLELKLTLDVANAKAGVESDECKELIERLKGGGDKMQEQRNHMEDCRTKLEAEFNAATRVQDLRDIVARFKDARIRITEVQFQLW